MAVAGRAEALLLSKARRDCPLTSGALGELDCAGLFIYGICMATCATRNSEDTREGDVRVAATGKAGNCLLMNAK